MSDPFEELSDDGPVAEEILDDDIEIEDTDLLDPTDDEPVFDELRPGDLSGDEPIELS
jgi:hypothetical protein